MIVVLVSFNILFDLKIKFVNMELFEKLTMSINNYNTTC